MAEVGEVKFVDLGSSCPIEIEIVEILEKEYKVRYLSSPNPRYEYLPKNMID